MYFIKHLYLLVTKWLAGSPPLRSSILLNKLGHDDDGMQQPPLSAGFSLNYLMVRVMRH